MNAAAPSWRAWLAVFALAALMRTGYVAVSGQGTRERVWDALDYHQYAATLAREGRYEGPNGLRASRMPGYPVFLAGLYRTLGESPAAVQGVQVVLSAAACVLLGLALAPALGAAPALFGAAAMSVYFDALKSPARLLTESLYVFLCCAVFFVWSRRERGPAWAAPAACGALAGAAMLVRPEGLLLGAAGVFAWLRRPLKASLVRGAAFAGAFLLVLTPWLVRNQRVLGRALLTTSTANFNSYVGLRLSQEKLGTAQGPRFEPPPGPELERDAAYKQAAREIYASTAWSDKLKVFAFNAAVLLYPFHPEYDPTLLLLLPFWAFGLAAALRHPDGRVFAGFLMVSAAAYVVFGSTVSRYREPLAPALCALAAFGFARLGGVVSKPRLARGLAAWAVFNVVLWAAAPSLRAALLKGKEALW